MSDIQQHAVSRATCLWAGQMSNCGSIPGRAKKCVSSPEYPQRLCNPLNCSFNGNNRLFSRLRMSGTIPLLLLHAFKARTVTTSKFLLYFSASE